MARVETELRVEDGRALFVVRTDDAAYADALRGLAYAAVDAEFVRAFPAGGDVERIYRRFERRIEELLEQAVRRRPVPWQDALAELSERLERAGVDWFVGGSAALAIRGIAVEPRDIDVVTTDHDRVAEALADALVEPPTYDRDARWIAAGFGRAFLHARVEWAADVLPDAPGRPPSEFGPAAAARLEEVRWNGRPLRLSPLDLQLASTEQRGLEERVAAIRAFQAARG